MLNRDELASFLRTRRERLRPHDVGLPDGQRRRTPGLRRQEVAQLASLSVDYYIRLEQARGPRPSRHVLAALARALMLSADEREYLFRVAGEEPSPAQGHSHEVPASIRRMIDLMPETPAYVVSARYDILAWNRLATFFVGDLSGFAEDDRNMIRWMFTRPADDSYWDDEQALAFTRPVVATCARRTPSTRQTARSRHSRASCSRCHRGSPLCGRSMRSARVIPRSNGSTTRSRAPSNTSARCCTSPTPTSG